ncbi:unnamed protein product [Coregonus sp. 'balchen']|nr:unnamed protein product [Coregonus sp. 'balchen']
MEGQSVTLYCQATSHPPSVVWSWSRLDEQGGWQEVGIRQCVRRSDRVGTGSPCRGLTALGAAVALEAAGQREGRSRDPGHQRGRSQPQAQAGDEGEVYMNCDETNQAYTDLYPAYMTGDDTYATLG